MFIRHFVAAAAFVGTVAAISSPALAQTLTAADFVHKATVAGTFEVEASKLALQKTQNPEVRALAQRVVDEHNQAADQLAAVAAASPASIRPASGLDDAHQAMLAQLENASGEQFDRAYIHMQADAGSTAVTLYSDYSVNGAVVPLRVFANTTLPVLEDHLQQIQNIAAKGL